MIEHVRLPDGTPLAVPAVVPKLSATPGATRWVGPALGQHTDEVLAELGFSGDEIERLRSDRVI
jgi:formyl-CoA transferase